MRSLFQTAARVPAGWWIVILTLPAVAPLMRAGFFESHDGHIHLYRLAALDRAVRAGVLYPRWFPEFAFGYGHPVLNFYGPLSYYLGLPFTLLRADATLALQLVFATGLIASALSMYLFAHLHLNRGPALVAAVVYAYLPYHLVDLYVRGALAEFLAFVWFPLVLWAFHRLVENRDQRGFHRVGLTSLLLAALLVTHSLSAFIFAPVLAIYVIILLVRERDRQATGRVASAFALTLAISAFYWLPVLAESQYVGLGHGASQGYQDHLLPLTELFSLSPTYPYPTEPGVPPTFPLGWVQVAIIIAAAVLLPFCLRRRRWVVLFFLALALCSAFMLTAASLPVWGALEPGLAFLQYPWRFQALAVLATAFLAGALVQGVARSSRRGSVALGAALILAIGVGALWRLPATPAAPDLSVEAMWRIDRDHGQVGATWTGEYLPIWVTEQRWAISHSAPEPERGKASLPAGQVRLIGVGHSRYALTLDAPQGATLALHQFYYPGWQAVGEGPGILRGGNPPYDARPQGNLGLATFDLPPSTGPVTLRLGLTPAQLWGTLLSFIASLAVGVALIAQYPLSRARAAVGPLLLTVCYLLLAAVLLASLVLPNGYLRATNPVNANLEDSVELLAFSTGETTYRPGDTVDVTLYWLALRDLDQDYKTFVHLTDATVAQQPAQHDGDPGGGFTPTTRWLPGELVPDTHHLPLPSDLAPGRYLLWAGMYEHETLRNLSVVSAEAPAADNRVLLGEIEVESP
jgi:hypothetical protein